MPDKSELGKRMKIYEKAIDPKLMRRNPIIIRLDGKAFHTFAKGMNKPFDKILMNTMQDTMKYLCENIQGCVLGYTQSDEISLLLVDYKNVYSEAWFDNKLQKMVSISSSMATLAFNRNFRLQVEKLNAIEEAYCDETEYCSNLFKKIDRAIFDARAFSIPKDEVNNCFLWRQRDASKNSVSMVAQANFSHKQLHKKNMSDMQNMLVLEKGINWNDLPTTQKRGSCCIKKQITLYKGTSKECVRNKWIVDDEIPIFSEDLSYIENLVYPIIKKE